MNSAIDFYSDLFSEMDRWQQRLDQVFRPGASSSLRALSHRSFPAINVGSTPDAVEVLALAPGITPDALQITIDKGYVIAKAPRTGRSTTAAGGASAAA